MARKLYCEVECADCTCDDGVCHGKNFHKIISRWNMLRSYGLTVEEAMNDMAESSGQDRSN